MRHLKPLRAAGDGALRDVQARQPPPRPAIRKGLGSGLGLGSGSKLAAGLGMRLWVRVGIWASPWWTTAASVGGGRQQELQQLAVAAAEVQDVCGGRLAERRRDVPVALLAERWAEDTCMQITVDQLS